MLLIDFIIYLSLMIMSLLIFSSGFFHLLKVLLALEFVVISMILMLVYYLNYLDLIVVLMYYMIFSVCEAILGLSLMVLMVRYNGNEYTKSIMIMKW